SDARAQARLHTGDRDAQHAAGCARRRHDRLLQSRGRRRRPPRGAGRVRRDRQDLHPPVRQANRGLRHRPLRMRDEFHRELQRLEARLQCERDLVVRSLRLALTALHDSDDEAAEEVIRFDDQVDAVYLEIEQGIQNLLATQTPVASDLRLVLSILHINLHLERMADYCVTIAKLVKLTENLPEVSSLIDAFEEMGSRAEEMIRVAVDSFAARDVTRAESLVELDELIDRANRHVLDEVFMIADDLEVRRWSLRMLIVSRCLERIGAHAVDIGEQTASLVTGEFREYTDASRPSPTEA